MRELLAVELGDAATKANLLKPLQRAFQHGKFESDSDVLKRLRRERDQEQAVHLAMTGRWAAESKRSVDFSGVNCSIAPRADLRFLAIFIQSRILDLPETNLDRLPKWVKSRSMIVAILDGWLADGPA